MCSCTDLWEPRRVTAGATRPPCGTVMAQNHARSVSTRTSLAAGPAGRGGCGNPVAPAKPAARPLNHRQAPVSCDGRCGEFSELVFAFVGVVWTGWSLAGVRRAPGSCEKVAPLLSYQIMIFSISSRLNWSDVGYGAYRCKNIL
jgi:hypothetical protein